MGTGGGQHAAWGPCSHTLGIPGNPGRHLLAAAGPQSHSPRVGPLTPSYGGRGIRHLGTSYGTIPEALSFSTPGLASLSTVKTQYLRRDFPSLNAGPCGGRVAVLWLPRVTVMVPQALEWGLLVSAAEAGRAPWPEGQDAGQDAGPAETEGASCMVEGGWKVE